MALNRPYIRAEVRVEVERRAPKNKQGQYLDANTGNPIMGQYDLGHKAGHEHWREVEKAEQDGLTQQEFNDRINNPDYFQIEDPHENRSHAHEMSAGSERYRIQGGHKMLNGMVERDPVAMKVFAGQLQSYIDEIRTQCKTVVTLCNDAQPFIKGSNEAQALMKLSKYAADMQGNLSKITPWVLKIRHSAAVLEQAQDIKF